MGGIIGKGEGEDRRWKKERGRGEGGEKRKLFLFTENDAKVAGRFIIG